MKKFWWLFLMVSLIMVCLGWSLVRAKDVNNLDQYDDQLVADVIEMENNFLYPVLKLFLPTLVKLGQGGEKVTTDFRLVNNFTLAYHLNTIMEALYVGLVNDSSCGEESVVKSSSWQVRMFGGLPGYCYFLSSKAKLKIERVALQVDSTGLVKNIACARNITGLEGLVPGQEEYVKGVLSSYFPDFQWGNLIWNPDEGVSFGVEVLVVPAKYLSPAK